MNKTQYPPSTLNFVPVEGRDDFIVVSGNSMEVAQEACTMARATGSVGATVVHQHINKGVEKFAIVKKRDKNYLMEVISAIPQQPQVQYDLQRQLAELRIAANRLGLYDAADHLRPMSEYFKS